MAKTKAEVDKLVRAEGENLVDLSGLTAVAGNVFIGETFVEGKTRFFEIKIVAKKEDFSQANIDEMLTERMAVENRKIETKAAAEKKKIADEKRRADAKAKKESEK